MSQKSRVGRPWGRGVGLLVSSLATLVGVVRGFAPEVILGRAVVAGVVCGTLAIGVSIVGGAGRG